MSKERRRALPRIIEIDGLVLDSRLYRVAREGQLLTLNPTNIEILALLMRRSPQLVTKEDIAEILWGTRELKNPSGVGTRVHEIRKAVDEGFDEPLVHTVYRKGYLLGKNPYQA